MAAELHADESRPLRRLLPDSADTTVKAQLDDLDLVQLAHEDRPYLVMNFVSSLDGHATLDGRSGPLGSDADMEMLQRLRTRVDAVMIGAGTMRAERYGRMVSDPELRARRERIGLPHDPLAVIVSGRLDLPWDAPLFTDGGGRIVVFTASEDDPPETATQLSVVRHEGTVDLTAAMKWLRHERGIRAVLSEGGPLLHGRMREEGLVDELFLTTGPKLVGGVGPRILEGTLQDPDDLELVWLLAADGELFARYRAPDEAKA
jgi:riboflavin-specific deaminase-like protein